MQQLLTLNDMPALAVSSGDPSGIGIEIALKAWLRRKSTKIPAFALLADPDLVLKRAHYLNLDVNFKVTDIASARALFVDFFPIIPLNNKQHDSLGLSSKLNNPSIIESITSAIDLVASKQALGIVTLPICKKSLSLTGFPYPGHTEFLAAYGKTKFPTYNKEIIPIMMLAGADLKTVPITIHIALSAVKQNLTIEKIVTSAQILHTSLKQEFNITNPIIAIAGLNPHAGEDGIMGDEELTIIKPAIELLKQTGIYLDGPLPADTLFHAEKRKNYDAVLCMYHDQALIPIKTLYFDSAVNITLGLPFIRTSPDHGTGFDIAGKNIASANSFIEALKIAENLAINRLTSKIM